MVDQNSSFSHSAGPDGASQNLPTPAGLPETPAVEPGTAGADGAVLSLTKGRNPGTPLGLPWPASAARGQDGAIRLGGVSVVDIAAAHGTPAYVMDESEFRTRARSFRSIVEHAMAGIGAEARVYYAGKALLTKAVATWAASEGLGIDCSTEGELAVALAAGIPGPKIGLHGNNKSDAEIATALDHGIGHIIIDSLEEIERIAAAAEARGMKAPVMVRAVTGVHAGGHEYISTGHQDQKFGLSMERRAGSSTSPAMSALCQAAEDERLNLLGIHSHIGSQILGAEGFEESAHAVMGLRAGLLARTGYEVPEVNLGGGYGIAYLPGDEPLDLEAAAQSLATAIKFSCDAFKISVPRIAFEPGRSIAGPAGLTLYTVGAIKDIVLPDASVEADKATARATPPTRRYISIDGGMSDNLRPALYGARYHAELANRVSNAPLQLSRIVGKHCESGDIVVQEIMLPSDVRRGDIIATPATGAYGRSMANNYNQMPRPPVVAVADGASRVILRRETVADLLALDEG